MPGMNTTRVRSTLINVKAEPGVLPTCVSDWLWNTNCLFYSDETTVFVQMFAGKEIANKHWWSVMCVLKGHRRDLDP